MRPRATVVGVRKGRLVATARDGKKVSCDCDCGRKAVVTFSNFMYGNTSSCGCLRREALVNRATTHGMTHTPEYRAWFAMLQRCNNEKHQYFYAYGGRGIKVCQAWASSFAQFFKDMGTKPSRTHSLDRRDVTKGYFPKNCRWATRKEQQCNKTNTLRIEVRGVAKTASEWADDLGIPRSTVYSRLSKGYSPEKTFGL